ncbi:MAG: sulfite exporter TauE/SafE family protein [bacterium]
MLKAMPGTYYWLIPVGVAVGALGTLIGAGGGFLLVPLLLLLYPADSPATITSISLAVVCCNATAGSIAYARVKRIDFASGGLFALATIPGAILGALSTRLVPRGVFNLLMGSILIVLAWILVKNPDRPVPFKLGSLRPDTERTVVELDGTSHTYRYNRALGIGCSLVVGYISSLLGIGGGILHVPLLATALDFPVHIATATSHFVLAIMAGTGTAVHLLGGALTVGHGLRRASLLGLGVIGGAPVGAKLSTRLHGTLILRLLGAALGLVGLRLMIP